MSDHRRFLVVDSNPDNGSLLVRSLARKFPSASIQFCRDSGSAIEALAVHHIHAVVLHRTDTDDAVHLIRTFLQTAPSVPIVAVSGVDRSESMLAAGAAAFMNYDEWLKIGVVVQRVLELSEPKPAL